MEPPVSTTQNQKIRAKAIVSTFNIFPYEPLSTNLEATALPKPIKRRKKAGLPKTNQGCFKQHNSRALTRTEFDETVVSVSENFERPNWAFIRTFADKVDSDLLILYIVTYSICF